MKVMDCGLLHENGQLGKLKKKVIQQAKHFHPVFNVNKLSQVVSELQVDCQYLQAEWLAQTQALVVKLTILLCSSRIYCCSQCWPARAQRKQAGLSQERLGNVHSNKHSRIDGWVIKSRSCNDHFCFEFLITNFFLIMNLFFILENFKENFLYILLLSKFGIKRLLYKRLSSFYFFPCF